MSPWKVILAAVVIFGSGVLAGVLVAKRLPEETVTPQRHASARSNTPPASLWYQQQKELLRRLDKELQLTAEQRTQIEKLLKESQERTKTIREKIAPEVKEEVKNLHDQIRAQLTPEQQGKFEVAIKAKPGRKDDKSDEPRKRKEPRDTNTLSTTNR